MTKTTITFHHVLNTEFNSWASMLDRDPKELRKFTRGALRTRRDEAVVKCPAHGRQPAILELTLDEIEIFFTIENGGIMVRGYGYDVPGEPLDDFDGGGFYSEYEWSLPILR